MILFSSLDSDEKNIDEYLFFSRMKDSKVIKIVDEEKSYYFLVSKDGTISNLKYSKENLLEDDYLREIALFVSKKIPIKRYIFFLWEYNKNLDICYNVIYKYSEPKKVWEINKYVSRFSRFRPKVTISDVNQNNLRDFYFIYKIFWGNKWFDVKKYEFFEYLLLESNAKVLNISLDNSLVWSVIFLNMFDKILLLYGWYDEYYIKKWLKYFVNNYIIDYYRNDRNIKWIIFGTWKDDSNIDDSLFEFKSKFWDCYILHMINRNL